MSMTISGSPQLMDGEYVLWQGKPPTGILFRQADLFMVPFSLMWGGFAIFWEVSVLGLIGESEDPISQFMALWGVPFVLIGLYLIVGRFFWDAFVRGRTEYFLTNRRAMIATTIINRKIKSFQLGPGAEVASTQQGDGSGDITFGTRLLGKPQWGSSGITYPGQFTFERVARVGDVLSTVSRIQSGKA